MNQALNTRLETRESPEIDDIGNDSFDYLVDLVLLLYQRPRVRLKPFQAEANPLALVVQPQDVDIHFLTGFQHFAGMRNPIPRQFRHMDQPIRPTQIHESSEISEATHYPMSDCALRQFAQELILLLFSPLPSRGAFRQDQPPASSIHFNHFQGKCLPHVLFQAVHLGRRAETSGQLGELGGWDETSQVSKGNK